MDKRIINVDTDESQSSEVARALGHKGEMSAYTWVDEATGTGMPWPPAKLGGGMVQFGSLLPAVEEVRFVRGPVVVEPGKDCGHGDVGFGCLAACGCCLMKAQRRGQP